MEWMRNAQPSLFAAFITVSLKKKCLRHVVPYLALLSLLVVVAEFHIGFSRLGRPCENGAFLTVYPSNNSEPQTPDNSASIPYHLNLTQNEEDLILRTTSGSETITRFKVLSSGDSVHMGHPDVFIPTAIRIVDFPQAEDFTILLHAWARNFSNTKFSCCLLKTLDDEFHEIVSVNAIQHKQNLQPNSNSNLISSFNSGEEEKVLSSEYYCSIPKQVIRSSNHLSGFDYVTFSSINSRANGNSCNSEQLTSQGVLKIHSKQRVFRSVGLCVSLQRTFVNAEYFVEWLEWYRLQGVTEIYVYYDHDLHKAIARVLQYYEMVGFVRTVRLTHPEYYYKEGLPEFNEEMASNDCRHRMSHFDYVITLDVSELIAPKKFHVDIYDILKDASRQFPNAGVFQIHSYQIILDWRPSKKSPLHLARHELRSNLVNMGEDSKLSRWAYMPNRANVTTIHRAFPKEPFTSNSISKASYSLLRFVRCHPKVVKECTDSDSKVKDNAISRFQNALITGMREIPIDHVLKYNPRYVAMFNKIRIPGDSYFIGNG